MKTIEEVKHLVVGIAFSSSGYAQGGKSVEEVNKLVSEVGKGFHEIQVNLLKTGLDERGDPAFASNEYIFIRYTEDVLVVPAKAIKKADA